MQTVCSKYCFCLADFGVQIGIGAAFGMLLAKGWPVITVLDGALVGAGSGVFSGLVGRCCMCYAGTQDYFQEGTVQTVIFRTANSLITLGLSGICHIFFVARVYSGKEPLFLDN